MKTFSLLVMLPLLASPAFASETTFCDRIHDQSLNLMSDRQSGTSMEDEFTWLGKWTVLHEKDLDQDDVHFFLDIVPVILKEAWKVPVGETSEEKSQASNDFSDLWKQRCIEANKK